MTVNSVNNNDSTYNLFKTFTKDPLNDLVGRQLWVQSRSKQATQNLDQIYIYPFHTTNCSITYTALMSSMFGIEFDRYGNKDVTEVSDLSTLKTIVNDNTKTILEAKESSFFAYGFAVSGYDKFEGHSFVIIQSLGNDQQPIYKIYQSFLNKYTLAEYLEKNNNTLDQKEFNLFLDEFNHLLEANEWSDRTNLLFQNYFKAQSSVQVGDHLNIHYKSLYYGIRTMENTAKYAKDFEMFKASDNYPKMIFVVK